LLTNQNYQTYKTVGTILEATPVSSLLII